MSEKAATFDYEKGEETIKPSWRRRAEKFFNNSTFNGALYVFASKLWLKRIFWGVIIVIVTGGFCVVTVEDIIWLVCEPTATSITLIRQRELSFPAVTICSLNLLNTTTLESTGATVVNDLNRLSGADPPECKVILNKVVDNTGINVSWGEITNLASNNLSVLLRSPEYHY